MTGLAAPVVHAQGNGWPSRPIRPVVPYPPGGTTDILARVIAERLGKVTGATFIVENRAGAGGIIGSEAVAKAPPDGTTLLLTTTGPHGSGPALYPNLPFDPMADFTHLALIASPPNVLSVRPASPLRTLADLVAAAKASPGNVTYGSPGNGTLNHLAGPLLEMSAGIRMQHVPYRGASPAQLAVLSGEVDVLFDALPSSAPLLRDGRLRALAMGSPERMPGFTDIPTFVEQGHPEVVVMTWFGLAGPRNMPPALAQRMNETVISILHEPEMAERLTSLGSAPNRMAIPEFTRFVEQGIETWKRVVKAADIRLD